MAGARTFPALEVTWPEPPTDDDIDLILAAVDDDAPTGLTLDGASVRFFFTDTSRRDHAARTLREARADVRTSPVDVPDEHWAERSQASIGAIRVGAVVVAPPWVAPEPAPVWIVVQPSMGFGTGHHASTRLCLALLQDVPLAGRRVLDLGTGSGVLAVAAARLGAAAVLGVDSDPDAIECAHDTVARNGQDGVVRVRRADLVDQTGADGAIEPADVVLANITGEMLARHAGRIAGCASRGGCLILGGIMRDEAARVERAYTDLGWRVDDARGEDDWVGLRLSQGVATSPTASTAR